MASPTLTSGGITFTFNDGDVSSVEETISGAPDQTPITGQGPMGAYMYDYEGVQKRITLQGQLTAATSTRVSGGYTVTTILSQKQWLESLLQGNQTSITFTSTYSTQSILSSSGATPPYKGQFASTKVFVENMRFVETAGSPASLQFSITLLVGQA